MSDQIQIQKSEGRRVSGEAILTLDTVDGAAGVFRAAELLSRSSLVPEAFRARIVKGRGDNARVEDNPDAAGNCAIAIDMAVRMGIAPLAVCQNLYIVEGKPSWASPFVIASINRSGKFAGSLGFALSAEGTEEEVSYTTTEWSGGQRTRVVRKMTIRNRECYAYAVEARTGEHLRGPVVSMRMAVAEGWLGKDGSKWQSMPEMMLRYRAAAFFGRIYAPELLLGIPASDELEDIAASTSTPGPVAVEPQAVSVTAAPAPVVSPAAAARAAARKPRTATEDKQPVVAEPAAAVEEPQASVEQADADAFALSGQEAPYSDAQRNALLRGASSVPESLRRLAADIARTDGIRHPVDACVAMHTGDSQLWERTVGRNKPITLDELDAFLRLLAGT